MSEAVLVAIISGGLALIGVVISNIAANSKMTHQIETAQKVTDTKIDELTREVREHNNFARRMPVIEEKVESLESQVRVIQSGVGYSHRSS